MSESAWIYWHSPHLGETAKHVGRRGEKGRVDNQNLVIVIICKLSLLHPSVMEYETGATLSPVNQHSTRPGWHHVWYPRSASQDNVSSNNGLNWDLGRWWSRGKPSLAQCLYVSWSSISLQLFQGLDFITMRRTFSPIEVVMMPKIITV